MKVKCPYCGVEEEALEEYVGETAICDSCQGEFIVGGVAVPSSSFDEQGNAAIECPYCHAQSIIKLEYANRDVRCSECNGKYHIQVQGDNQDRSEWNANGAERASRQEAHSPRFEEDEIVRFEGIDLLAKISPGHILRADGKPLIRFALSLPLGICKPIVVMCKNCKRFDVAFVKEGQWQMPLCCECGKTFLVGDGRSAFLSEIGKINDFKTRKEEISLLHKKFKTEERIFEGDWDAFIDPKSTLKIERIKGNIDRLYKRLQISESKRLVASHDKQTGAIIAFTNNWNSTLATVGGLISLMANADNEQSIGNETMSLQGQIDHNENILNYYYDLVEEFTGVDKLEAKRCRMKKRTGYSNESELPCLCSQQDAVKCADIAGEVKKYANTKIRSVMRASVINMVTILSLILAVTMLVTNCFSIDIYVTLSFVVVGAMAIMIWLISWLYNSDDVEKLADFATVCKSKQGVAA